MLPTISLGTGFSRSLKVLTGVLLISSVAACGTTSGPGDNANLPDASSPLPAQWKVLVKKHPRIQYGAGNWQFTCSGNPFQDIFTVNDNQVVFNYEGQQYTAPLSEKRKFKVSIPLDAPAKTGARSDSTIQRDKRALIFSGSLISGKGRFTVGIEEFGYNGCSAKANYAPV